MTKKKTDSTFSETKDIPSMDPEPKEDETEEETISEEIPEEPTLEKPPEEQPEIDLLLCKEFACIIPFLILSIQKKDDKYLLTDSEKECLATLWKIVLEKHLPGYSSKYKEEMTLAIAIGTIWFVKSGYAKQLIEKPEDKSKTENVELKGNLTVEEKN